MAGVPRRSEITLVHWGLAYLLEQRAQVTSSIASLRRLCCRLRLRRLICTPYLRLVAGCMNLLIRQGTNPILAFQARKLDWDIGER